MGAEAIIGNVGNAETTNCAKAGRCKVEDENSVDPRFAEEAAWNSVVAWNREAIRADRLKRERTDANERRKQQLVQLQSRAQEAEARLNIARKNPEHDRDTAAKVVHESTINYQDFVKTPRVEREEHRRLDVHEKLQDYRA